MLRALRGTSCWLAQGQLPYAACSHSSLTAPSWQFSHKPGSISATFRLPVLLESQHWGCRSFATGKQNADQYKFDRIIKPAVSWFKASQGHANVPRKCVLNEKECREAGLPEDVKQFRLGQTLNFIRSHGHFIQTSDPSCESKCAANKVWLQAEGIRLVKQAKLNLD